MRIPVASGIVVPVETKLDGIGRNGAKKCASRSSASAIARRLSCREWNFKEFGEFAAEVVRRYALNDFTRTFPRRELASSEVGCAK
jgi:hypothetical protein